MNMLFLIAPAIMLAGVLIYTYFVVWRRKSERETAQLTKTQTIVDALRQERLSADRKMDSVSTKGQPKVSNSELAKQVARAIEQAGTMELEPTLKVFSRARPYYWRLRTQANTLKDQNGGSLVAQSDILEEIIQTARESVETKSQRIVAIRRAVQRARALKSTQQQPK